MVSVALHFAQLFLCACDPVASFSVAVASVLGCGLRHVPATLWQGTLQQRSAVLWEVADRVLLKQNIVLIDVLVHPLPGVEVLY